MSADPAERGVRALEALAQETAQLRDELQAARRDLAELRRWAGDLAAQLKRQSGGAMVGKVVASLLGGRGRGG